MRHCGHEPARPGCGVCRRYDADEPRGFRANSDRVAGLLRASGAGRPTEAPPAPAECEHLGKPTRPPEGKSPLKRWSLCTHPTRPLGPVVCPCEGCGPKCPGYSGGETPVPRFEWVPTARLVADAVTLAGQLPTGIAGVAGVPRSGMIPASVIATQLQLPLYELTEDGNLNRLGHGSRGRGFGFAGDEAGPVAVVDDTVYGGNAMRRARAAMALPGRKAVFAAVYVRPQARAAVDVFARELESPHLLEWNWANNGPLTGRSANPVYGAGVAADLDGVIVHDAESGGRVGSAYMVPRSRPIPLVVTGRHERHRAVTEELLRRVGCKWTRMEMLPDGVPLTPETAAAHKAKHYKTSGCGFFVESCPTQAALIHEATRKPVVCPLVGRVFQ